MRKTNRPPGLSWVFDPNLASDIPSYVRNVPTQLSPEKRPLSLKNGAVERPIGPVETLKSPIENGTHALYTDQIVEFALTRDTDSPVEKHDTAHPVAERLQTPQCAVTPSSRAT